MKNLIIGFVLGAFLLISSAALSTNALFVVMGGFNSCGAGHTPAIGMAMYEPFADMFKNLQTEFPAHRFHYIASCFKREAPPDGNVHYITSEQPSDNQTGNAEEFQGYIENFAHSTASLRI
ncbi:MAG: hypothetical protein HY537_10945, partial [Deltaproteobacteria bacterium]|nr:hypothetical protein [Deltaproteobacteria bacterium]